MIGLVKDEEAAVGKNGKSEPIRKGMTMCQYETGLSPKGECGATRGSDPLRLLIPCDSMSILFDRMLTYAIIFGSS